MITPRIFALLLAAPLLGMSQISEETFLGAADLTRDESSGLEWLDTQYTWGIHYSDIPGLVGPGSTFAGFRLATVPEWTSLYADLGIPSVSVLGDPVGVDPLYWSRASTLVDILGGYSVFSSESASHRILGGLLHNPSDESRLGMGRLMVYDPIGAFSNSYIADHYLGALTLGGPQVGAFLVRDIPQSSGIPEPSTYGLAATLLLACVLWLRRYREILKGREAAE